MRVITFEKFRDLNFSEYEALLLEEAQNYFAESDELRQYMKTVFFSLPGAACFVLEHRGKYLSTFRLEPYSNGLLLNALQTKIAERRKGYAFLLVSTVLDKQTVPIYSHVHRQNKESMLFHRKVGFVPSLEYAKLLDGSISRSYVTLVFDSKGNS